MTAARTGTSTRPRSASRSRRAVLLAGTGVLVVLALAGFAVVRALGDQVREARIETVSASGDGRVLAVTFLVSAESGCGDPRGVRVEESPAEIRLTAQVVIRDVGPDGKACPLVAATTTREVRLADPLGDRTVIDASRDEVVPT